MRKITLENFKHSIQQNSLLVEKMELEAKEIRADLINYQKTPIYILEKEARRIISEHVAEKLLIDMKIEKEFNKERFIFSSYVFFKPELKEMKQDIERKNKTITELSKERIISFEKIQVQERIIKLQKELMNSKVFLVMNFFKLIRNDLNFQIMKFIDFIYMFR